MCVEGRGKRKKDDALVCGTRCLFKGEFSDGELVVRGPLKFSGTNFALREFLTTADLTNCKKST